MTTEKEYPLIENLDRVKRKKFESPEQRLHAIVTVLHEEATTRYSERDSDRTVPVENANSIALSLGCGGLYLYG
jgi:hypothetical protein